MKLWMSYDDVLGKHKITYEQYDLVRQNLVKKGLLISKTDLIVKRFRYLRSLKDQIN